MDRCKYESKLTGLRNEMKYDTKKLGHYIALHSPKNSQYSIKELKCDIKNKYTEIKFSHEIHTINYPSITHNCYSKTKKNGTRIVILHIVNKMYIAINLVKVRIHLHYSFRTDILVL
jgi:hypothetical protein